MIQELFYVVGGLLLGIIIGWCLKTLKKRMALAEAMEGLSIIANRCVICGMDFTREIEKQHGLGTRAYPIICNHCVDLLKILQENGELYGDRL